jgi:hypothetical protein
MDPSRRNDHDEGAIWTDREATDTRSAKRR